MKAKREGIKDEGSGTKHMTEKKDTHGNTTPQRAGDMSLAQGESSSPW
jgi:hypothetical protein